MIYVHSVYVSLSQSCQSHKQEAEAAAAGQPASTDQDMLISGALLVTLLLEEEIHGASALGIIFSLIDVRSAFTACVVFFILFSSESLPCCSIVNAERKCRRRKRGKDT
eukprot:1137621-Pelagomonas_calceolata.AAC.2